MKRHIQANITDLLAIVGGLASFISLVIAITSWLGVSLELTISIISVIVSFVVGMYSMYVAKVARKLPRSKRVFLSYSHQANPIAYLIADKLKDAGAKVWLDAEQLQLGEPIEPAIEKAIGESDTFIVLVSGLQSPNLKYELDIAYMKGKRIIPVIIEDTEVPVDLQKLRYIDLTKDKEIGIQHLVDAVS